MSDGSIRSARLVVARPDDGIRGEGATFALHLMEGDTLVYESREFTGDDFHHVNPNHFEHWTVSILNELVSDAMNWCEYGMRPKVRHHSEDYWYKML